MHGGIGFTWEHDTNVYYRRAIVLAAAFGAVATRQTTPHTEGVIT